MLYSSYIPSPPVSDFVDCFWLCADKPLHTRERILPSGTFELVINLDADEVRVVDLGRPGGFNRFSGAVVSGAYAGPFVIDPSQHTLMMGVHFKPGGAFPLFGAVVGELANMHLALEDLWGRSAVVIRERLCAAHTNAERFLLMQDILSSRLLTSPRHHAAVSMALGLLVRSGTQASVQDVARQIGLSQRRFIQVFTEQVGLTPKLFSRILRFQQARRLAGQNSRPDWADVALSCGYFDQSHLIRDFGQFSGMSPAHYLRRQSDRVMHNHVPIGE